VAIGTLAGRVLAVTARHIEPSAVHLVEISDFELYLGDDDGPH
jgi:hypothetical protein